MKVALIVNSYAGLGGPAGLKGSDAADTISIAQQRGVSSRIGLRLAPALQSLQGCELLTAPNELGEKWCREANLKFDLVEMTSPTDGSPTTAEHTKLAVKLIQEQSPDLLIFAGGDGTARDVFDVIHANQVVLGIPCGVKMHSAVFANNPSAARDIIQQMNSGKLLTVAHAEVRDIDEQAFRSGTVKSKYYGEMWVPESLRYMQQVKAGGKEVEALVVEEIAADFIEKMQDDVTYMMGSGSTTAAIMRQLGLPNTLLGVDVVLNDEVIVSDAYEAQLKTLADENDCRIVVTVIGGQGHLFGRGNQQFSPRVIRSVGLNNLMVVATKSKLEALVDGIVVDTGEADLDADLAGYIKVLTGFDDAVFCPVRC